MASKKIKFDDTAIEESFTMDKDKEKKAVYEAFREFLKSPVPEQLKAYEFEKNDLVVEVFKFDFSKMSEEMFLIKPSAKNMLSYIRFFSFAKVLAVGPESKFKVGDIVKLNDSSVLSAESSKYVAWVKNGYNSSNLKKIGQEPPRFVSNIYQSMGKYSFIVNPLDVASLDTNIEDSIYKINDNFVSVPVKDIDILLK